MKRYLLIGYLGANNLGDECMLRRFLQLFDPYPEVSFTIFSYGVDYTSGRIRTSYHRDHKEERWQELVRASRDVDGVVWVGGNCFTDFDGDGELKLLLWCKLHGKGFYYAGVGLDEMCRMRRRVKSVIALNLADGVIVRDSFSLSLARRWTLARNKISLAPDLGELYLRQLGMPEALGEEGGIVVSWRNLEKNLPDSHHLVIEALATELALLSRDQDREIVIFDTDDRMDREANRYLARLLRDHGVGRLALHEGLSLDEKLSLIAAASAVVTARLHTGVAGVLYRKPTAIFKYSMKIEQFAARAGGRVVTLAGAEEFSVLRGLCNGGSDSVDGVAQGNGGEEGDERVYLELAARLAGKEAAP